jgi:hypothetical protein
MRQFLNWFRTARSASRPAAHRNRLTRPTLEPLEDRKLMSVVYGGGPLLDHVQIETVFYGQQWHDDPALYQSTGTIDGYFNDITQSSYMDLLNEYGVGRGSFRDGVINLGDPPRGSVVDDTEIQTMLDTGIHQGYFDAPSPNQLYFVYTLPNVLVTSGNGDSQTEFLGYHTMFNDPTLGPIYYAVIPHPIGNSDIFGFNSFQQQTDVSSHELAEAVTDPDVQTGWQDPAAGAGGEIGDLAEGYHGLLDGYVVQAEYLNSYGGPVIPYGSTPYFPGGGFAAIVGAGQGQPGANGYLSISLGSPIPASGSGVFTSTTDFSETLAAGISSHGVVAESHRDDFFAALAAGEKDGTDPLKLGSEHQRAETGTGWDQLTFAGHGKATADLGGRLASDLAGLDASSF